MGSYQCQMQCMLLCGCPRLQLPSDCRVAPPAHKPPQTMQNRVSPASKRADPEHCRQGSHQGATTTNGQAGMRVVSPEVDLASCRVFQLRRTPTKPLQAYAFSSNKVIARCTGRSLKQLVTHCVIQAAHKTNQCTLCDHHQTPLRSSP